MQMMDTVVNTVESSAVKLEDTFLSAQISFGATSSISNGDSDEESFVDIETNQDEEEDIVLQKSDSAIHLIQDEENRVEGSGFESNHAFLTHPPLVICPPIPRLENADPPYQYSFLCYQNQWYYFFPPQDGKFPPNFGFPDGSLVPVKEFNTEILYPMDN